MKIKLSAVLLAALVLGGCAPQSDAGKQQVAATPAAAGDATPAVAVADAQQAPVKKKKCDTESTGSRLANCHGSTDAVMGSSGDNVRDGFRNNGNVVTGVPHN